MSSRFDWNRYNAMKWHKTESNTHMDERKSPFQFIESILAQTQAQQEIGAKNTLWTQSRIQCFFFRSSHCLSICLITISVFFYLVMSNSKTPCFSDWQTNVKHFFCKERYRMDGKNALWKWRMKERYRMDGRKTEDFRMSCDPFQWCLANVHRECSEDVSYYKTSTTYIL